MRKLTSNNSGSAVPLLLFIITIIACGALYTLFFVEVGFPSLRSFIPESDSKTYIMMGIYAIPMFILIFGVFAVIRAGIKENFQEMYYP